MLGLEPRTGIEELTRDTIMNLARLNPVIAASLSMHLHNGLEYEQSLILMVKSLHDENESLRQLRIEEYQYKAVPSYFERR
ncbi:MAG: hypothetical protein JWM44_3680 [Bacilli bacterium]|nr:hypothetical protein [Bacilli bacterium]